MNAEIIAIGSELLLGQIANTNAQFLSKHLATIGVNVYFHTVVGDNKDRLIDAIENAQKRSDLIIFTGGLGPTKDDLTKETIAQVVGRPLVIDRTAEQYIELYFQRRNRVMTENNRKQALVIETSTVLPNDHGMAPGMAFKEKEMTYLLFPGPPKEMEPMFLTYGLPYLLAQQNESTQIFSRVLHFYGIGESQLETELLDLIEKQTNPTIAPLAKDGEVTLRLTVKHEDKQEGIKLIDEVEKEIQAKVGKFFYGYDDTSLVKELALVLQKRKLTIAVAESLTGGLFSKEITTYPGISTVFKGGVVCYSNEVKKTLLHVPESVLETYGAISEQCAKLLAENVRNIVGTDIGISFTGVAGPGTIEEKEVGTVFIAIAVANEETKVYPINLAGTRDHIQGRSVKYGLFWLLKQFS